MTISTTPRLPSSEEAAFDAEAVTLTVGAFIRDRAARFGDHDLLVRGDERLTYVDAELRSRQLARQLITDGLTKADRVGIIYDNTPEWIVVWLAVTRMGATAVPISTYAKPAELYRILRHADVSVLCISATVRGDDWQARIEETLPELRQASGANALFLRDAPALRAVRVEGSENRPWAYEIKAAAAEVDDAFLAALEAEVVPSDPAVVIYTSGSTSVPKGVIHSHAVLIRHAARIVDRADVELDMHDRVLAPMPFFWVGGLVTALVAVMHVGATLYCPPRFRDVEILDLIESERITVFRGIPQVAIELAAHPSYPSRDLSCLRTPLTAGGSASSVSSLGMTETCGPHTMASRGEVPPEVDFRPFGWPVEGFEHKVVDPDTGRELCGGAVGELCVRGEDMMLGLIKRDRNEVFDADGFYHTGDMGRFVDGVLDFVGRRGDMIKTKNGMNVAPREVEAVLEGVPEIVTAVVVGLGQAVEGQEVAAAIVVADGVVIDQSALLARMKLELSTYKVPTRMRVFEPDKLPTIGSGKLDRASIAQLLAQADEVGLSTNN